MCLVLFCRLPSSVGKSQLELAASEGLLPFTSEAKYADQGLPMIEMKSEAIEEEPHLITQPATLQDGSQERARETEKIHCHFSQLSEEQAWTSSETQLGEAKISQTHCAGFT